MRVLSNLAVKKLCFCSLLFPSAGRKWNIAGTNVRSEPLSFVKSAGEAPGTRALVPGALIENDMAKTVCLHDYQKDIMRRLSEEWLTHLTDLAVHPPQRHTHDCVDGQLADTLPAAGAGINTL